jgi:hypothetical protein
MDRKELVRQRERSVVVLYAVTGVSCIVAVVFGGLLIPISALFVVVLLVEYLSRGEN